MFYLEALTQKLTFLNIIIGQSAAIFQLFSGENQPLLIWRDALLILNLCLNILDGIRRLYLKGNGLPRQGFDENLHGDFLTLTHAMKIYFEKEEEMSSRKEFSSFNSKTDKNLCLRSNISLTRFF